MQNVEEVGGKGASLGEMEQNNFPVPTGFVVTSEAYFNFMRETKIQDKIVQMIDEIDVENTNQLDETSARVRKIIENTQITPKIKSEITANYNILSQGTPCLVAVRSSATAEDLPEASFAGQQETYLNIQGAEEVAVAVQRCWASLFTARAVYYRKKQGFDTGKVGLCAVVQKMVESDVSGIMFTADPTGDLNKIIIEAGFGLGETIVSGSVTPDNYVVDKKTMSIANKKILKQEWMLVKEGKENIRVNLGHGKSDVQKMSDEKIVELAQIGQKIEEHYKKPMDIEWAMQDDVLYIVQARPITTLTSKVEGEELVTTAIPILEGLPAAPGVITGIVRIVPEIEDIEKVMKGDILVTKMTSPSWVPVMKKASGIITNEGGRTCFDGETKLLTDQGFMTFKQIHNKGYDGLKVLSFNKQTMKTEWKPIIFSMKKNAPKITISISQSGKITHNTITITPDHKMINIRNANLVDTEIQEMIANNEMLCITHYVPSTKDSSEKDKKMAYFMGGIMTDGSVYQSRTHGEVQFIQKNIPKKEEFIEYMNTCAKNVFNKEFAISEKNTSTGFIRGNKVEGSATAYRLYSKQIAQEVNQEEQQITQTLLQGDTTLAHNFLAGVIDGDGSFYNNRINIYVSEEILLQAVIVSCLRIGTMPQVTINRNIWNVQIVEKLEEILKYTKRVKGEIKDRVNQTRLFSAKQLLTENSNSRLRERALKNLYVSDKELLKLNSTQINSILESDIKMQRINKISEDGFGEVYNITVDDTHTYVAFTKNLSPLLVNNCHAAIVSRELQIPCVVGTSTATELLKDGQEVTIDGFNGKIYAGKISITHIKEEIEVLNENEIDEVEEALGKEYDGDKIEIKKRIGLIEKVFGGIKYKEMNKNQKAEEEKQLIELLKDLSIKVKVNVALPDAADAAAMTHADGVGLLRAEHMITSNGIHPAEYIRQNKDVELKDNVKKGIRVVAEKFTGPVWFRTFDARSDEYKELVGGDKEPKEENPMIGWHGIRRDIDEPRMLRAQLLAVKELYFEGIKNVGIMIPFVISLEEVLGAKKIMDEIGMPKEIDTGVMIETPAAVWVIDELIPHIKFVSFGTNDLTQLTLGIDRNNERVQKSFSELHPAILRQLEYVIKKCKSAGVVTSICGQAASNPDMVKKLIWYGIDSVSANIDAVDEIRKIVIIEEKKKILELYRK